MGLRKAVSGLWRSLDEQKKWKKPSASEQRSGYLSYTTRLLTGTPPKTDGGAEQTTPSRTDGPQP
jgi:hypothetical protein